MSKKPPLRPPILPPSIEKPKRDPNNCVIHNGPLRGKIYTCEKCGAKMCYSCAIKRKNEENKAYCPICTSYLFVKESELL